MTDNEKNFILELEKLTRKYKISLISTGYDGAISLSDLCDTELNTESGYAYSDEYPPDLRWIYSLNNNWEWNHYKRYLVKES